MEKICPKCGAPSGSKKFFGEFCEDCYLGMIDIQLPAIIKIPVCRICGKARVSKWDQLDKSSLENIVKKNVEGTYDSFHISAIGGGEYEAVFLVSRGSDYFEIRRKFYLKMSKSICENCSRETSGYYEAIIQVRGKNSRRWSEKIIRELRKRTFVSKYTELSEGVDIYVGSRKEASRALAALKRKPTVSDKLYGVKDGRRVYRRTYCVRV